MDELAHEHPLAQEVVESLNPVDRVLWSRVIERQVDAGPDSFLCKTTQGYGYRYAAHAFIARLWLIQAFFFFVFMMIALAISRGSMTVEATAFLVLALSACLISFAHGVVGAMQRQA